MKKSFEFFCIVLMFCFGCIGAFYFNDLKNEYREKEQVYWDDVHYYENKYKTFDVMPVSIYKENNLSNMLEGIVSENYRLKLVSNFNDTISVPFSTISNVEYYIYKDSLLIGKKFTYSNPTYVQLCEIGIVKNPKEFIDSGIFIHMNIGMFSFVGLSLFCVFLYVRTRNDD